MNKILEELKKERFRQNVKWGIQNRNAVEWIAILTEEVGEASREAVDFYFANGSKNVHNKASHALQLERLQNFRKELIQTAAVAIQAVENIDRETGDFEILKTEFSKDDALELMRKGFKITHQNFSSHEYMTIQNGKIVFEDGVIASMEMFWMDRTAENWKEGYRIFTNANI